jgi:hypothetical protein
VRLRPVDRAMSHVATFGRKVKALERDRIAWDRAELKEYLVRLWNDRDDRWVVLPFNVRTQRLLWALRRHFDYKGWRLITISNAAENEIGVMIRGRATGARVRRSA